MGPRFSDALVLANDLHAAQRRKGTEIPYIAHLLAVAALVLEGRATLDRIRVRFGDRVADIVASCSDAEVTPKPPWRERKAAYVAGIPHKSVEACLVSLADKVHNARAILTDYQTHGEQLWGRFTGGRDGTLWYYQSLREAFRDRGSAQLWAELDAAVRELESRARGS